MGNKNAGWIAAGIGGLLVLVTGGCCIMGGLMMVVAGNNEVAAQVEPVEPFFAQPQPVRSGHTCNGVFASSTCSEYPAGSSYVGLLGEDLAQEVCTAGRGTWGPGGGCPLYGKVGSCLAEGTTITYYNHGASPFDAYRARATCESAYGLFIPVY